ncbi:MAG: esterase-like activity of phytase family protein [Proteobacteria bacterium]|nr:esterase-like activity of phytase family protein [Pseudomonadota bacterium]
MRRVAVLAWIGMCGAVAAGSGVFVRPVTLPAMPLGVVSLGGGRVVNLSVSAGAGAFHAPGDPSGRIWTITDRGPAIDCNDEREVIGADDRQICATGRRGKIYLLPTFVPSIYGLELGGDKTARLTTTLPLKGSSGRPLTGIVNPGPASRSEVAYDPDGQEVAADPSGIAPGGLVRLSDGSFFVADAFGPSVLEVAPDGTVRRRIVPQSMGEELRQADYPVEPSLPAILSLRQTGRGFEGIAVSADEKTLFVAMQSPLVNPTLAEYRTSPFVRLYGIDRQSGQVTHRYLYPLDAPDAFQGEHGITTRPPRQSDVRLMEVVMLENGTLLCLERLKNLSRIYRVSLADAVEYPKALDDPAVQPALEKGVAELSGVVPLRKTLLFESDPSRGPVGRLTGMAVLSDREIVVVGNNDFGIDGSRTQMFRLTFPASILN